MAFASVRHLSEMEGFFRLDAEFWNPDYVSLTDIIQQHDHSSLGELSHSFRKGIFYILASEYTPTGIPLYRSNNVGQVFLDDPGVVFISKERHAREAQTALERGDIVLAKTGKVAASIVTAPTCNISQDVIGIRIRKDRVNRDAQVSAAS